MNQAALAISALVLPLSVASPAVMGVRVGAIVVGLGLWYLTQALIGRRASPAAAASGGIFDGVHHLTRRLHAHLLANPRSADLLLLASSLVIDLVGGYVLAYSVVGATIQPFVAMLIVFALRQICQAFCPLPPPDGMIWRSPGFPTVLVTYGTTNDLFFSGHTSMAVVGALCLGATLGPVGMVLGALVIVFEIGTVLVLRAHYTMDVFTGAVTALYAWHLSTRLGPAIDGWIAGIVG